MKVKYIVLNHNNEPLLKGNQEFPELTGDDFDLADGGLGGLGDFTIAKYSEDGLCYIELTLSPQETEELFKFLH